MLLNCIYVACFATETVSRVTRRSDSDGSSCTCGGGFFGFFDDDGGVDGHGGHKHQGGGEHHGGEHHVGPFAVLQAPVSYYITFNHNSSAWSLLFLNKLMIICVLTYSYSAVLHSSCTYRIAGNIGGNLIWRLAVETKSHNFISTKFNFIRQCVGVYA